MKQVHILSNADPIPTYTLAPVRHNIRQLRDRGYAVRFFSRATAKCLDCDILCLVSKPTLKIASGRSSIIEEADPLIQLLKRTRKTAGRIVWMDDADSTSVTHFELLPYIDLYLKKQLFKDLSLYRRDLYGGRLFTDFYHRNFGIEDSQHFAQFHPLSKDQEHKVQLSWNIGLGDMMNAFEPINYMQRYLPRLFPAKYNLSYVAPDGARPIDVFLRTSANMSRKTIAFHRQETLRRLSAFLTAHATCSGMSGNMVSVATDDAGTLLPSKEGRMPRRQLLQIMANTKVMPSPFGWGEIGVRDYEAFINGAMLLKPDMSHMATWPDIFIPGETYQPISWGFEDIEEVLEDALRDDERRQFIARNGQEAYRQSISDTGMEKFCSWFIQQMNRISS